MLTDLRSHVLRLIRTIYIAARVFLSLPRLHSRLAREGLATAERLETLGLQLWYLGRPTESIDVYSLGTQLRFHLQRRAGLTSIFILPDGCFESIGCVSFIDLYLKRDILSHQRTYYLCLSDPKKCVSPFLLNQLVVASSFRILVVKTDFVRRFLRNALRVIAFPLDMILTFNENTDYGTRIYADIQRAWDKDKRKPLIDRHRILREYAGDQLAKLGITEPFKHVCLHVRESGFRNDASTDSYRSANIKTFYPAIQEIERRGFRVVRMGDPTMSDISDLPNVIDYAHSDVRSPLMDALLIASCHFCLATHSGVHRIAVMMGVPTAVTDMPLTWLYFNESDIYCIRKLYSAVAGRELTLSEMLEDPLPLFLVNPLYELNKVIPIDNTSAQITQVVNEIFQVADNGTLPASVTKYRGLLDGHVRSSGSVSAAFFENIDTASSPRLENLQLRFPKIPGILLSDIESARRSAREFLSR